MHWHFWAQANLQRNRGLVISLISFVQCHVSSPPCCFCNARRGLGMRPFWIVDLSVGCVSHCKTESISPNGRSWVLVEKLWWSMQRIWKPLHTLHAASVLKRSDRFCEHQWFRLCLTSVIYEWKDLFQIEACCLWRFGTGRERRNGNSNSWHRVASIGARSPFVGCRRSMFCFYLIFYLVSWRNGFVVVCGRTVGVDFWWWWMGGGGSTAQFCQIWLWCLQVFDSIAQSNFGSQVKHLRAHLSIHQVGK